MTVSRWKVMAGVLGVSLGGLAAIAGQSKPDDAHRTRRADEPPKVTGDLPKLPPVGSGPMVPMPPSLPTPAELPAIAPPSGPGVPAVKVGVIPDLPSPAEPKVTAPAPPKADVIPAGHAVPQTPPTPGAGPAAPAIPDVVKPMPTGGSAGVSPSPYAQVPSAPPASHDPLLITPPRPEPVLEPAPARPAAAVPVAAPAAGKPMFRIILRVGEGEPMFEVRQGDDLMMKVVCEKVDVKSPEKGTGPSSVTAAGKVRFVGFGAEGTCDQLAFMAGTGEVALTGAVKIQVKDKLGRVESELTSDKMRYRLDAGTLPAAMKP